MNRDIIGIGIHLGGRNLKRPTHPESSDFSTTSNTDAPVYIVIIDSIRNKDCE